MDIASGTKESGVVQWYRRTIVYIVSGVVMTIYIVSGNG